MLFFRITRYGLALAAFAHVASAATATEMRVAAASEGVSVSSPERHTPAGALAGVLDQRLDVSRASDAAIAAFYGARGHAPLWLRPGGDDAAALALLDALRDAPSHALPAAAHDADRLAAAMGQAGDVARAEAELALTRAYLRYARDVTSGVLDPRRASRHILRRPVRPDPADLLTQAAISGDMAGGMAAHLAALAPSDPGYAALKSLHALYADKSQDIWGPAVPTGATLRQGDRGPRVAALRARLQKMGDLTAEAEDRALFDAPLAAAVRRFQERHGLNMDAAVGPMTLAALNTTPAERARQIAVNLERMRWLNHPLGERRVVVNQAAFTVTMYEGDTVLFHERVVVGTLRNQTPEFSDAIDHLVFNPTWFVPRSIATQQILPRLQEDPTYLLARNMVLNRPDGGPVPDDVAMHDFNAYTTADFPYRIRQRPNPANALGLVKFMFPNNQAIYLHDTPDKHLFARDQRTYSWGCVRVQDPMQLAELILAPERADPRATIDALLGSGRERYVHLDTPVPVHLTYRTAWIDDAGQVQFRADVYERDADVAAALEAAGVSL